MQHKRNPAFRLPCEPRTNRYMRPALTFPKMPVKALIIFAVVAFTVFVLGDLISKNEEATRLKTVAACRTSPVCQDDLAQASSMTSDSPIQSKIGRLFFKGKLCSNNCSGHMAGYRWAKARSVSNQGRCIVDSSSFTEGCLSYIDETARENRRSR